MTVSLYFYVWLSMQRGRTMHQAYATWKRFHLYRVENGFTHPDLYS